MQIKRIANLALVFTTASTLSVFAQDEGFMYGKVTTYDKQVYEGPIRWGDEETYWIDVFNASKAENNNLRYLSREQKEKLDERHMANIGWSVNGSRFPVLKQFGWTSDCDGKGSKNVSWNYSHDYTHQFSCQFGEIKSIRHRSSKMVELELQGGVKFDLDGEGYNDVEAKVKVLDKEIGEIELNWDRIERVDFKPTPSKLTKKFGEPLYGTVQTYSGSFTGLVQWDHDERLSEDKLDGHTDDGKVSVPFGNVKSIERLSNRSRVLLKSGREMELNGTNDVNSENRGIIVTDENGIITDIPWSEFKKLTLAESSTKGLKKYDDFKSQKEITTTVNANGKALSGKTVIDLDEEYDFELFQGKDGDVEYSIPMRAIRKIDVINPKSSEVTLKSGKKLTLKESQDVGDLNQGVLIFTSKSDPVYVPWNEVKDIEFN